MKKFKIKYETCFSTRVKTMEGRDSQDALNKFLSWASDQIDGASYKICLVIEAKPSFRSQVEAAYRDLGLVKRKGSVSGATYWE